MRIVHSHRAPSQFLVHCKDSEVVADAAVFSSMYYSNIPGRPKIPNHPGYFANTLLNATLPAPRALVMWPINLF